MKKFIFPILALAVFAFLLVPRVQAASTDYFIKIDDIKGESTSQSDGDPDQPVVTSHMTDNEGTESEEMTEGEDLNDDDRHIDETNMEDSHMDDNHMDENEMNDVSIHAVDVRGWDIEEKKTFLETVKEHAQVQSGKDLENFATGVLLKDENLEDVSVNDKEIKVSYRTQGKILGFIPHKFTEEISVNTDPQATDRVKVRFPWYRFLMSVGVNPDEIQSSIETALNEDTTPSALAETLQNISDVLKASHDAAMNSIRNIK